VLLLLLLLLLLLFRLNIICQHSGKVLTGITHYYTSYIFLEILHVEKVLEIKCVDHNEICIVYHVHILCVRVCVCARAHVRACQEQFL